MQRNIRLFKLTNKKVSPDSGQTQLKIEPC